MLYVVSGMDLRVLSGSSGYCSGLFSRRYSVIMVSVKFFEFRILVVFLLCGFIVNMVCSIVLRGLMVVSVCG